VIGVAVGRYRGVEPRSNVSMIIIRPPQHGHGWGGWSVAAAPSGARCFWAVCAGFVAAISSRARVDDYHAATATRTWVGRLVCRRGAVGSLLLVRCLRRFRRSDQLTRPRDGLGLGAAGEQTVVPAPVEPVWQDVEWMRKRRMNSPGLSVMVL
jgi:hypothetical protein